jgi:DegV family protein with EDD domain
MAGIGIVTDSTAYLDREYARKHDIKVVPLKVIMEGETYREGVDITNDEFYRRLKQSEMFPTTSQPSVGDFLEAYREMAGRYDALLSVHISAGISGTVESAKAAAAEMDGFPVEVIDSRYVAVQLYLIVDRLVRARDEGKGMEELKKIADETIRSSVLMFVVDTLEYLHRGGRIGGAQAFLGSMLRIKPILYIDGTIDALEKVRGSAKALDRLVELAAEKLAGRRARVGVTHVQNRDRAEELLEKVKQRLDCDPEEILFNETGPVIGAHVGPGTVGVGFYPLP